MSRRIDTADSSTKSRKQFSLMCQQCGTTGAPVRVESQTETVIILAIKCGACTNQWTVAGDLPAFMAWLKPDRRRHERQ